MKDRLGSIPQWFTALLLAAACYLYVHDQDATAQNLKQSDENRAQQIDEVKTLLNENESKHDIQYTETSAKISTLEKHISYIEGSLKMRVDTQHGFGDNN